RPIVPEGWVGDIEEGPHRDNLRDIGRRYVDVSDLATVLDWLEDWRKSNAAEGANDGKKRAMPLRPVSRRRHGRAGLRQCLPLPRLPAAFGRALDQQRLLSKGQRAPRWTEQGLHAREQRGHPDQSPFLSGLRGHGLLGPRDRIDAL